MYFSNREFQPRWFVYANITLARWAFNLRLQHKTYPSPILLDPGVQRSVQVLRHPAGNVVHLRRHFPVDALDTHRYPELEEGYYPAPVGAVPEQLLYHRGELAFRRVGCQVQSRRHLHQVPAVAPFHLIPSFPQDCVESGVRVRLRRPTANRGGGGTCLEEPWERRVRWAVRWRVRLLAKVHFPVDSPIRKFLLDVILHYNPTIKSTLVCHSLPIIRPLGYFFHAFSTVDQFN